MSKSSAKPIAGINRWYSQYVQIPTLSPKTVITTIDKYLTVTLLEIRHHYRYEY